jgi:type I restriction-modification system DNA methylase subunit
MSNASQQIVNKAFKGDIYEGLLAKSAAESPKGAGQYFTPRELIKAIVDVMQPQPGDTVCDPACGTGGFLLAAHDYVSKHFGDKLDTERKKHLRQNFVRGWELVPATARLCIMNLYLHGIKLEYVIPARDGLSRQDLSRGRNPLHSITWTPACASVTNFISIVGWVEGRNPSSGAPFC